MSSRSDESSSHKPRVEIYWLIAVSAIAALTLGFGLLAEEVFEGDSAAFDQRIILLFRDGSDAHRLLGPGWLPETLRDVTSLGSTAVLGIVLVLASTYLIIKRRWRAFLILSVTVLSGQLLSTVLKISFHRTRPELVAGAPEVFTASFPSGHAMMSAIVYMTLGSLLARYEGSAWVRSFFMAMAITLAVLVGISRVLLGVHWPTDVLAGWAVGAAWAIGCTLVFVVWRGSPESTHPVKPAA